MRKAFVVLFCCWLPFCLTAASEDRLKPYDDYIKRYAPEAMRQQMEYGVPSSITLAQGLLESNAGNSTLARKSNNHFGIKCGISWNGDTFSHFDDGEMSCFRKYRNVSDSYRDHSEFLSNSQRYRKLFSLTKTDYKGWARGLKAAGYATDRQYADKLIRLIEVYELYKYDKIAGNKSLAKKTIRSWEAEEPRSTGTFRKLDAGTHQIYYNGTTPYIIAEYGDSYLLLTAEFDVTPLRIKQINDFEKGHKIQPGEWIYLGRKARKWEGENDVHILQEGESLHSVSQKYGVRLKSLVKLNEDSLMNGLAEGDSIRLR